MKNIKRIASFIVVIAILAGCSSTSRLEWLKSQGGAGHYTLYSHYLHSHDVKDNLRLAKEHLRIAADMGNKSAAFTYAVELEKSLGIEAAIPYYKEAASVSYNGHSQLKVAYYLQSQGEHETAEEYFAKAAKIGYPEAVYELANYLEEAGKHKEAFIKFTSLTEIAYKDSDIRALKLSFRFSPLEVLKFEEEVKMIGS